LSVKKKKKKKDKVLMSTAGPANVVGQI
jgi:hypothetical protein